ncbi:hypothetical protein HON36_04860 [Candidatus Parcubacteria bacterium]|jgi:hypothetical protein|nr:hypothetical protein [Candidatus Parcubacteria bacterium]
MLKNISKFIFTLSILALFASSAQAAHFSLNSKKTDWPIGQKVEVVLNIDTENQKLNAFEGEINYPAGLLDFDEIRDNDSLVTFWVEKPMVTSSGTIKFSGIVPGGFEGKGKLFRIFFITKDEGDGNISINKIQALLNDGQGTEVYSGSKSLDFDISGKIDPQEPIIIDISDTIPPEPFSPIVTKIPEIAGDDYLLIFATQDKGSGIDYYEIKEGLRPFSKAESPYVLKNQKLNKKIIIKAVDKFGNERKITIDPVYPLEWYEKSSFFAIIILVIVISFFLGRTSWKKPKQKK